MKYELSGETICPIVRISLSRGESALIKHGGMAYMRGVEITGGLNAKQGGIGGVFSAIGRSLTSGESMFITTATATADEGEIAVAPPLPGKIVCLQVGGGKQYRLNTGSFLACDSTLNYSMVRQTVGRALFGGTGGLFVMETNGEGEILVAAFGDFVTVDVTPDTPITIDNEHVLAWDSALEYHIEPASGMIGFTTGEGLVNKFTGTGRVYLQTRNVQNLAEAVSDFIPSGSSS